MPADMKKIIAETFLKMIQHKNIDKITVKALIEECHISRQTFYYHFQDIMDVLEWSLRQATQLLSEKSLQAENMRSALQIFISFTVEQFPMVQKLMNSQRRSQIEQLLIDSVGVYLNKMAEAQSRQQDVSVNYADRDVRLRSGRRSVSLRREIRSGSGQTGAPAGKNFIQRNVRMDGQVIS